LLSFGFIASRGPGSFALDERYRDKGGKQRQRERDIRRSRQSTSSSQEQDGNASAPEQLPRHHSIGVFRTAQDANQANSYQGKHQAGGDEKEVTHRAGYLL
jgi:hypothetical protein